jgi:hypothetical protein
METRVFLTNRIYEFLPDWFDFFVLLSTNKLVRVPLSPENSIGGSASSPQVNYSGVGRDQFDFSASYGSDGRLLGTSKVDAYSRGVKSFVVTHEIVHQWSAYIDPSLGLNNTTWHYNSESSAGSLTGGFKWTDNGDGTFTVDCLEGGGGAHRASPLDRYMMGLIDGSEVPTLYAYDPTKVRSPCFSGDPILADEIVATVTIENIQRLHGIRTPGPANSKRDFRIAFVAESQERLLNLVEMTFYNILAEHYTKPVPPGDPDPYAGSTWVSIARFFGDGVTWRSDIGS